MPDTIELIDQVAAARPEHEDALVQAVVAGRLFGSAHAARLGRFTLIERIGRGGTGDVFAAYDPLLDRKLALKVLRTDAGLHRLDADEREWLLREARAAARLAHPNVVAIHEVGELGQASEGIYVAMEYIAGTTLRAWLREPRSLAQILAVFVQAGRGLAAAHAAGVVHRDFKPENVLICGEGPELRARVVDFGLARVAERRPGELAPSDASRASTPKGTPAYMAPEQLRGQGFDARSDQFGFCVALHEALTGEHPFAADRAGTTIEQLLARMRSGERRVGERALPGWLRPILRRGLAIEPDDRHPSMLALVDVLRATPARRRRRRLSVAGVALVIGSSALTIAGLDRPGDPASCASAAIELRGVWDPATRAAARSAFARSELANADEVWSRVAPRIDAYAEAWIADREQTCHVRRIAGASERVELRDACLDRRRAELRGLTELLVNAESTTVLAAIAAVDQLGPIAGCDDLESLRREAAIGDSKVDVAEVEALRQEILRRTAQARAGRASELADVADELVGKARALALPIALAEALVLRGMVEEAQGDYEAAANSLEAAAFEALAAHHDRLYAEVATRLVWVHGVRRRASEAARGWVPHAEAAIRAAHDDPHLLARLLDHRGTIASLDHDYASAEQRHREALALRRSLPSVSEVELAASLGNLGRALLEQGRPEQATPLIEESLTRYRAAFGPSHPDVAAMLSNLGQAHVAGGELERGRALLGEALALKQRIYGPNHVELLNTLLNLANVESALGRSDAAQQTFARALAIGERSLGPESPQIEALLHNLAFESWLLGDHQATLDYSTRALALQRRVYGDEHPILALTYELRARAQLGLGQLDAAGDTIALALRLAERGQLGSLERGNLRLSAAVIERARGGSPTRVRALAREARELLGEDLDPSAARELAGLLEP
ncbi:protein kinase domain-containing protein [Nannocystaceae bacterium ST9]